MAGNDQNSTKVKWWDHVTRNFTMLKETGSPDCKVYLGTEEIQVHKTVLELTSSILTSEDVELNKQTGIIGIQLAPEFLDHVAEVKAILDSLCDGTINMTDLNMKVVYKFCVIYSIKWLAELLRPNPIAYITAENGKIGDRFVEIFKFSQMITCPLLQDECIGILNDDTIALLLAKQCHHELDFHSMKTICQSGKLSFSECLLVEMIISWCRDDNNIKRSSHLEDLLGYVQFGLIPEAHRMELITLVLNTTHISEDNAGKFFRALQELSRNKTDCVIDRRNPSEKMRESSTQPMTPVLENVRNACQVMENEMKNGDYRFLTTNEVISLEGLLNNKESFGAEASTILNQYVRYVISDVERASRYVSFNSLLLLYNYERKTALLLGAIKTILKCPGAYEERLRNVNWAVISYDTIFEIVNSAALAKFLINEKYDGYDEDAIEWADTRFPGCTQLEIIMLWGEAHQDGKMLRKLLNCICYRVIPKNYTQLILKPYVEKLLGYEINLQCTTNHNHQETEKAEDMIVESAAWVYLKDDEGKKDLYYEEQDDISLDISTSLDWRGSPAMWYERIRLPGFRVKKKIWKGFKNFILFDGGRNPEFPMYPIFLTDLHPESFNTLVEKCQDLHFMFSDN